MNREEFEQKLNDLKTHYKKLGSDNNEIIESANGIYNRYKNPVITNKHIPLNWRYDFNFKDNPFLLERLGINAVFNGGALKWNDKFILVPRIEGHDRKSFFAVAESSNGIDNFQFWDEPIRIPQLPDPDVNAYDMRIVLHEDGWIYGVYCSERKDPNAPESDMSSAIASAAIVRTKNLLDWERLPDLKTPSPQQRNVVLFPEFVDGKYAFYTRPQDGFIEAGSGGGIGWGLCDSIANSVIDNEIIVDDRFYHTIKESKNGLGPAPIKTKFGWLQLAHGVRNTAAGLRYVLYLFMTSLKEPWKVIYRPSGYFMAPEDGERVGDVSNVLFSNGWIEDDDGTVFIYYASSDTRLHVATSSVDILIDYVKNTPEDAMQSAKSVDQRISLINKNRNI